jgi:ribosomal-protein-alanine N-acetyltransferase
MHPILDTARLRLRPAGEADIQELWALWREPQVRQFLWDNVVIDRNRARETIHDFEAVAAQGLGLWTIVQRDDSAGLVGCAALTRVGTAAQYYPPIAGAVEPLVALARRFWYRGYGVETLTVLVEYATETLLLERLVGVTDVPNIASDRLLRRVGFVPCAETDGPRHRLRHYRLERERTLVDPINSPSSRAGRDGLPPTGAGAITGHRGRTRSSGRHHRGRD